MMTPPPSAARGARRRTRFAPGPASGAASGATSGAASEAASGTAFGAGRGARSGPGAKAAKTAAGDRPPAKRTKAKRGKDARPSAEGMKGERIARRLARAGLCSRREAERWIAAGRIGVDGVPVTTPAVTVTAANRVTVDGKPVPAPAPARLWRFHKPAGLICTARDAQGRPTIFERLPADMPRVVSVGRLDLASEGLMLVTNDGALARHLELPATGWVRRYRVRVYGPVDPDGLKALAHGITVAGVAYGPVAATLDSRRGANAWLTVSLREGKNREIRRLLEHLGVEVNRLIRTAFGPFQLGKLARGAVAEVPAKVIRDQVGADFASAPPRRARRRA